MKKTIITTAILAAMSITGAAQAANITNLSINDVIFAADGTTRIGGGGGFAFAASGSTAYTKFFDSTIGGGSNYNPGLTTTGAGITGGNQGIATSGADDSFTTGFTFTGYTFLPTSVAGTGVGLGTVASPGITFGAVSDGDSSINYTDFNWSGKFGNAELFPLSPTGGVFTTNTLTQGGSCSAAVGSNTACYATAWEAVIAPQAGFEGPTIWKLEGIATLDAAVNLGGVVVPQVPVPAAVWLFGSGLLGLVGVARRRRNA